MYLLIIYLCWYFIFIFFFSDEVNGSCGEEDHSANITSSSTQLDNKLESENIESPLNESHRSACGLFKKPQTERKKPTPISFHTADSFSASMAFSNGENSSQNSSEPMVVDMETPATHHESLRRSKRLRSLTSSSLNSTDPDARTSLSQLLKKSRRSLRDESHKSVASPENESVPLVANDSSKTSSAGYLNNPVGKVS